MSDYQSYSSATDDSSGTDDDDAIYNVGTAVDRHRGHDDVSHPDAADAPAPPAALRLSINEGRVLGSLIEKQFTTPDLYPLSLNGVMLACNQSTNREPIMALSERDVMMAITTLKEHRLARFVHPTSGRGVTKYRQVSEDNLALSVDELAVLGVLLLRGPQTSGELRLRTERIHGFDTVTDVEQTLQKLRDHRPPLAVRLDRQPGQKDARWQQLLAEEAEVTWSASTHEGPGRAPSSSSRNDELTARVAALEAVIAELQARLGRLEEVF